MRKILIFIIAMFALSPATYAMTCDQQFYDVLRFDRSYSFGDTYNATNNVNRVFIRSFETTFTEQFDYNESSVSPDFEFTQPLTDAQGIIYPGENYEIIETVGSNYTINAVPTQRSTDNLQITYELETYEIINNQFVGPETHTECINYEISWCGDGIVEPEYGETCDPNAPGWSEDTCSQATCEPIEQPTCEGLTATPISGLLPTNSDVVCAGNLVDTWEIDCGNGQSFQGTGNNGATESFRRTCNYTSAGTFTPTCTINGSITSNACQKTVTIEDTAPSIMIDKTDSNADDLDPSIGGNDSQTINRNRNSEFRIRVTNNGNEDLTSIELTDTLAPQCAGSVTLPNTTPSTFSNFVIGGAGNNADAYLQPNEYFEYTCIRPNTPGAYVNTARVDADGRYTNGLVDDTDTSSVILAGPSININKVDANPTIDLDPSVGNDTQTVTSGDDAIFRITVLNDGQEDLTNIVLTDTIAPQCAGSVTLPNTIPSTFSNFSISGTGDNADGFLQPGESFSYTCTQANTTQDYINIATVDADGRYSNDDVVDVDDTEVLLAEYDLALAKTYTGPANVAKGDTVIFNIRVTNQGEVDASDIEITDYIPDGLTLNDSNWTLSGNLATQTIASLPVNSNPVDLSIQFTVDGDIFGTITNFAEISADDGEDCDSTPDNINGNQIGETFATGMVDDQIGVGCQPGDDEDDHDLESIEVLEPAPAITLLKYSANQNDIDGILDDSNVTNDTQSVLIGSGAVFKIVVENTGTEDLEQVVITDAIAPVCNRIDVETQAFISLVGNNDTIFNPGELFEYECTLSDTQADYTNSATVDAVGTDTNTPVDSTDTTEVVVVLTPSIIVDKIDNKIADLDGVVGNDSQTINLDGTSTFTITVTNDGTEDLNTVVLTDALAPACDRTDTETQVLIAAIGNNDTIFNVGEVFSYECDDENVLESYTNVIGVTGIGVTSNTPVDDDDDSEVIIELTPSIDVDKLDNNSNDIDGTLGNDIQTIVAGSGAVFTITVTNDGTEDLNTVVLTDALAPACDRTDTETQVLIAAIGNNDTIFNVGEVFSYECIDENVTADYINSITVTGIGVTSNTPVDDEDTSDVEVDTNSGGNDDYDLALIKTLSATTPGPFIPGGIVTFDITVTNQGDIDASDIEVTDYVPTGLTLTGGSVAVQTIPSILVGESEVISISFEIDATATGSISNYAEISADDGEDCDSTPDNTNGNTAGETVDTGLIDNDATDGCNPDGDEDDHDVETIEIVTDPSIEVLKYSTNTADEDGNTDDSNDTNDTQDIDSGDDAVFKIVVTNDGAEDLITVVLTDALAPACDRTDAETQALIAATGNNDTVFNVGESFTYNCTDENVTSDYTNSITVTAISVDSLTDVTDTDTSRVEVDNGGGGSSGGSIHQCYNIETVGTQVTCIGNAKVQTFRVDCDSTNPDDGYLFSSDITQNNTGRYEATLSCSSTNNPICYVYDEEVTTSGGAAWRTSNSCQESIVSGGGGCGNGIVEPSLGEQCEPRDSEGNVNPGCTSSCKLQTSIFTIPSQTGIITYPQGGELKFDIRSNDIVLGDNMKVSDTLREVPSVTNDTPYDLALPELCLIKQSGTSLESAPYQGTSFFTQIDTYGHCVSIGDVLYPGETQKIFDLDYEDFVTTTDGIAGDYEDNVIALTIKDDEGKVYDTAYFSPTVTVRVAKPTIATTGGTAYFEDSFIANLTDVSEGITETTTNFGGVVVSNDDNLGDNTTVTDTAANDNAQEEVIESIEYFISPSEALADYNGNSNIQIIHGTDLKTSSLPSSIDEPTTFIVENADLIVDENIAYDHSVGFIVRGGNVIISDNVTSIDGSYVAISNGNDTGFINGVNETQNQLVVNGSLYGDTTDLISKRSYVKSADDNSGIHVGTIVSFGSSFFRDPAPLLGKFISEYTDSVKVAQ